MCEDARPSHHAVALLKPRPPTRPCHPLSPAGPPRPGPVTPRCCAAASGSGNFLSYDSERKLHPTPHHQDEQFHRPSWRSHRGTRRGFGPAGGDARVEVRLEPRPSLSPSHFARSYADWARRALASQAESHLLPHLGPDCVPAVLPQRPWTALVLCVQHELVHDLLLGVPEGGGDGRSGGGPKHAAARGLAGTVSFPAAALRLSGANDLKSDVNLVYISRAPMSPPLAQPATSQVANPPISNQTRTN